MSAMAPVPGQFDRADAALAGVEVLRHGLPPLPAVLTRQMSVPVAFWTAAHSAVVLFLRYEPDAFGDVSPMALMATYARNGDGWSAHSHWHGHGWSHDPIADPDRTADLGGQAIAGGGSGVFTDRPLPGHPAYVMTGRVSAAVTAIAVIQDGHEDRRNLDSHFGALVICTELPVPFQINALNSAGAVIGSIDGPPRF
jgi:hypothetical protein